MLSAFGVEHGDEVNKAFKMPGLGGGGARVGPKLPKPKKAGFSQNFGAGYSGSVGGKRRMTMPNQNSLGFKAGKGTSQAANWIKSNPMKATGGVLGGGGVALTGGVYANRKKPGQP